MKVMERGEIIADFCHIFECKLQIKRKMKQKQEGTTEKHLDHLILGLFTDLFLKV